MNRNIYEKMGAPSRSEGKKFLNTLRERGVLAANFDDVESKMTLVKLGLTMPPEKSIGCWLTTRARRSATSFSATAARPGARRAPASWY